MAALRCCSKFNQLTLSCEEPGEYLLQTLGMSKEQSFAPLVQWFQDQLRNIAPSVEFTVIYEKGGEERSGEAYVGFA